LFTLRQCSKVFAQVPVAQRSIARVQASLQVLVVTAHAFRHAASAQAASHDPHRFVHAASQPLQVDSHPCLHVVCASSHVLTTHACS
jgi:hypothetical protein